MHVHYALTKQIFNLVRLVRLATLGFAGYDLRLF